MLPDHLEKAFERWWPDLKAELDKIPTESEDNIPTKRATDEVVNEILERVREIQKQQIEGRGRHD